MTLHEGLDKLFNSMRWQVSRFMHFRGVLDVASITANRDKLKVIKRAPVRQVGCLLKTRNGLVMQVRVLFFGILRDFAGSSSDSLALPEGATLGDVLQHYETRIPQLKRMLPSVAISVNQEYSEPDVTLHSNDEIAFLPPVSGGSQNADLGRIALVREKIDGQTVTGAIKAPEDGAVVVFEGVVRNNTRGRRTLYLDYEAYEAMALKQLQELVAQALGQFKIRDVAVVHRLGRLQLGETSVLIAVASAHRAAAFDACHWLIDTLKRTVPIWKKEYFDDGAVWADGEPFPAEIPRAESARSLKPASK